MKKLLVASAALLAAVALTSCSASTDADEPDPADVVTLSVGDCFNDVAVEGDDAGAADSVPIVSCDEPHDNEVYYEFELPEGDYPGVSAIEAAMNENCAREFQEFVGIVDSESDFFYFGVQPTELSWNERDDRLVQCAVFEPNKQVTGTLKGAAR
ncbi:septum formation family protein [Microbacterium sp. No. 7]|uniref:septum formation family protein n=1 Tax=Microbacterium sp. No. 7 TaxID=1714373 RepID=UPI0006D1F365|nr:septum formation family protein [Microbacterium sp. No. 7]